MNIVVFLVLALLGNTILVLTFIINSSLLSLSNIFMWFDESKAPTLMVPKTWGILILQSVQLVDILSFILLSKPLDWWSRGFNPLVKIMWLFTLLHQVCDHEGKILNFSYVIFWDNSNLIKLYKWLEIFHPCLRLAVGFFLMPSKACILYGSSQEDLTVVANIPTAVHVLMLQ